MQPSTPTDLPQPAAAAPNPATEQPASPPQPAQSSADHATPAIADDGDLIEKEWVHKVKQILTASADNPYEQNRQLTRLRADYMQKRYGKDIKVDS